jgi:DNA-directed RNA polymerase specialized sigma24 family protein
MPSSREALGFDTVANARSHNYKVLADLFGEKLGKALYGGAIKIAHSYGVDIDDVVQELAIAATEVKEAFGFLHINTACYKARDSITKTYNYGVNKYFGRKGVTVAHFDCEREDQDDSWVLSFADEGFDWNAIDTRLCVNKAMENIKDPIDLAICRSYLAGLGPVEIGKNLGIHYTTVIKRCHRRLAVAFATSL